MRLVLFMNSINLCEATNEIISHIHKQRLTLSRCPYKGCILYIQFTGSYCTRYRYSATRNFIRDLILILQIMSNTFIFTPAGGKIIFSDYRSNSYKSRARKTNEKTEIALMALVMMLLSGCGDIMFRKEGIVIGWAACEAYQKTGEITMYSPMFLKCR